MKGIEKSKEGQRGLPDFLCPMLFALCSMLFSLCFLLFIDNIDAQQSPNVTYLDSITEDEEGKGLSFPSFVFVEPVKNEIYVISSNRITIYTSDFFPLYTLIKRNGIEAPLGLTVDAEGNLYVIQTPIKENPKSRISVFNACLKWERDIYLEGFKGAESFSPYRLALDKKGDIYVAGTYKPGVLVLNNKGKLLEIISPEESGKEVNVNYVTIDQSGKLFIVSEEEGHIYVYDENRKFLFKFGEKGGSTGKLSRPQAVGIDNRNGRMYVVDYMRHTISVYDKEGTYLFEFGGLGWGEGWFQYPKDIAVDSSGRIFVADTFNNRIEVFQAKE
jgi:DNA-binding beta-propeller fold protein YncE